MLATPVHRWLVWPLLLFVVAFAGAVEHPGPPATPWPIELREDPQPRSAQPASERASIERALTAAGVWLASFPRDELRFDAAIVLWHIRLTVDSQALRTAWRQAHAVAAADSDNPARRFWDPEARAPAAFTSSWTVPNRKDERVNPNRVLNEALHCIDNGWRSKTSRYITGAMRDNGGYHTIHGLWALHLAHNRDCLSDKQYRRLARPLQLEIEAQQPDPLEPTSTRDIDLFGERTLMLLLTGYASPELPRWIGQLLEQQDEDGSWGIGQPGEDPYFRYHATMIAAWTLSLRYRQLLGSGSDKLRP